MSRFMYATAYGIATLIAVVSLVIAIAWIHGRRHETTMGSVPEAA